MVPHNKHLTTTDYLSWKGSAASTQPDLLASSGLAKTKACCWGHCPNASWTLGSLGALWLIFNEFRRFIWWEGICLSTHFIKLWLDRSKNILEHKVAHLFRLKVELFPLEGYFFPIWGKKYTITRNKQHILESVIHGLGIYIKLPKHGCGKRKKELVSLLAFYSCSLKHWNISYTSSGHRVCQQQL